MIAIKSERDTDKLIEDFKKSSSGKELGEYIKSKLTQQQGQQLDKILHDDNALKELLNSRKAKELLKKLTGDGNGLDK